jgi:hypothetical protein
MEGYVYNSHSRHGGTTSQTRIAFWAVVMQMVMRTLPLQQGARARTRIMMTHRGHSGAVVMR